MPCQMLDMATREFPWKAPMLVSSVITWLRESDPAISWQTMGDLTKERADLVASERQKVAREGWGARILQAQSPDGHWGGDEDIQDWMRTIYTLLRLKALGLDPASEEARVALDRVRQRITWWQLDGRPFFEGETEPCINGGLLVVGAYFRENCEVLLERLLGEQLEDGGWNCDAPKSRRSSFHTTICVLEGLLEYEKAFGTSSRVTRARSRGQEYLLQRRLFRSLTSGEVIDPKWALFSFPTTWHYDVLRALDYLRDAGTAPDDRVDEAVGLVAMRQNQNGRWPVENPHYDLSASFPLEGEVGSDSRWNTLRALRVLNWYSTKFPSSS